MSDDVIAIVVGNGFTKVWTKRKQVTFKSVIATEQSGINFAGFGTQSDIILEWEGIRYAVGDATERLSRIPITTMTRSRIGSQFYKVLLLAAISEATKESGAVRLAVTLPVDWYQEREEFRKGITGCYTIKRNNRIQQIEISAANLRILPEGFGVLAGRVLSPSGQIIKNGVSNAMVGIVEIGTGTTDLSLFDALKIVPARSKSYNAGLRNIWEAVQVDISKDHQRELTLHQIDEALRKKAFNNSGEPISTEVYFKRHAPGLAGAIAGYINNLWDDGKMADHIYFAGGGAPQLYQYFNYRHGEKEDRAWNADVYGVWLYAMYREREGEQ